MSKQTSNKFSPEVRSRAVRLVLDQEAEHRSRWTAIMSIAAKIGCTPQTLLDWVKKAEVDSGKRAGVSSAGQFARLSPTRSRNVANESTATTQGEGGSLHSRPAPTMFRLIKPELENGQCCARN